MTVGDAFTNLANLPLSGVLILLLLVTLLGFVVTTGLLFLISLIEDGTISGSAVFWTVVLIVVFGVLMFFNTANSMETQHATTATTYENSGGNEEAHSNPSA